MEGDRQWGFSAPAFGTRVAVAPPSSSAGAHYYCPAGWRKRSSSKNQGANGSKRHKVQPPQDGAALGADAVPPPAQQQQAASPLRGRPSRPLNPAELAPLRCIWPHPAMLDLLAQQCWPAAGPAVLVLVQAAVAAAAAAMPQQLGRQPNWWNRMLPSLSLLHAPLSAEQEQGLLASDAQAVPLPQPNVLVGYQDDWLEVAPQVLPLWAAAPLAPFAGPKPLLHYLVCPEQQLPQAQQLVKDVGSLYETCNLGTHLPASSAAVHAFPLHNRLPAGAAPSTHQQPPPPPLPLAQRYLAGLRRACEQLQLQLLLDPPEELLQQQGSSLEDGAEPAVLVYIACPLEGQADLVAALLEAAACLAPCTPLGAAAGSAAGLGGLLGGLPSELDLGLGLGLVGSAQAQPPLAPGEPPQPDRPAGATPANDSSRAAGASLPVEEQAEERGQQQQGQHQQLQGRQQYRGAARVLHQQQQGDFRQLPVRQVVRPEGSRPLNIVLQVLSPQALADSCGAAARCTAFSLYSKVRHMAPDSQLEPVLGAAVQAGEAVPPCLPFCSQPLLALAAAAPAPEAVQQQRQQQQKRDSTAPSTATAEGSNSGGSSGGGAPSPERRTLHCAYALPAPGTSLLPLAVTDCCGELLHVEVLGTSAGGLGSLGTAASSSDSLAAAVSGAGSSHPCPASQVCRRVLQRCLELLRQLRAASSPANLLHDVAIVGRGMQAAERLAWQQLLEQDPGLALDLPAGAELAVLDMQVLPPARFAGPDPPSGCKLVMQRCGGSDRLDGDGLQATVAWLPPPDGISSLLPREHDVVRCLELALVSRCQADEAASAAIDRHQQRSREDSLRSLAGEVHGLAWLHAAFQGACLRSVAGGGQPAAADAHLPVHAALAAHLQSLLAVAALHPPPQ